jgi:hypothetical protein
MTMYRSRLRDIAPRVAGSNAFVKRTPVDATPMDQLIFAAGLKIRKRNPLVNRTKSWPARSR